MTSIDKSYKAVPVTSPDRVPRQEAYEKVWPELVMDSIPLYEGAAEMKLCTADMNSAQGMEVKGIYVELIRQRARV